MDFCYFLLDCGVGFQELFIFRDDAGDLSLLEHYFGDEDFVGVAGIAPRHGSFIFCVPLQDEFLETGDCHIYTISRVPLEVSLWV